MALADIVHRTRALLYGQGLGEKPAMRVGAADAAESVSGQLVTFALASDEGAKCKPGQVLAVYDPSTEGDAHVIYITSIATDTVTGVNGYLGSPAVVGSDSGDLDSAVFEQSPLATMYEIYETIDTVVARYLWPEVYTVETKTIASPNLVDGQEAVASDVMEILHAWQVIGSTNYRVACDTHPKTVNTSQKSTGRLAEFNWYDGSTGYYTVKTKIVEADEASEELTRIIATGAAALLLGASVVEATLDSTKKDNTDAVQKRNSAGSILWRDFLTLKQQYSTELSRDHDNRIVIDRG